VNVVPDEHSNDRETWISKSRNRVAVFRIIHNHDLIVSALPYKDQ